MIVIDIDFTTKQISATTTNDLTLGTGGGGAGGGVESVGLTMPSAFTVANSPITSSGDIAVTGAGLVSQYVRGDGSLANFPASTGGGASQSFYLNGSVSQGTFGGVAFKEMDRVPILGAGTDFTINTNGYIQSFITDANVPNLLEIPAGNWNFETYFSASSGGGSPSFYLELYKWNGSTLSLIASNSATPEGITNGTVTDLYVSALAVPQTALLATDRLAIRVYVNNSGRTITLHTENNHLCQVITTFSTGITALNGLTDQVQNLSVGTSGTDFAINSATGTHTFNLPTASAANRGALSSADWTAFNGKQNTLVSGSNIRTVNGNTLLGSTDLVISASPSGLTGQIQFNNGGAFGADSNLFWDNTNKRLGVGATPATTVRLDVRAQGALSTDIAFRVRNSADTLNTIQSTGDGKTRMQGSIYYTEFDPANGLYVGNNFGNQWNLTGVIQGTSWMANGSDSKLALGKSTASYRLDIQTNGAPINGIALRLDTVNSQLNGSTGMAFTNTWTGSSFGNIGGVLKMKHTHLGGSGVLQNCQFDFDLNYNNSAPTTRASITGKSNILIGTPTENVADSHTIYIPNGTAPTASITDGYKQYSADITAGNAAPHFRTENGAIVKVYQETTAVVAAAFVSNTSLIVDDSATYGGYTMGQVVAALKAQGLLA
jgi:hypothetical protein